MACRKENEKIFRELFDLSYEKLYYAAMYIVGDKSVAEDMVEDGFVRLWEGMKSGKYTDNVNYSFILTIVYNSCLDYVRHKKVESKYVSMYMSTHDEAFWHDEGLREERLAKIAKVRDSMPEKTRRIMDLCYYENKRYEEVAQIMGLTKNGVRKQMIKALAMLRAAFSVNKQKRQYP